MAARCLLLVWVKSAKGIPQPRANVFQERGRCWGILPSGGAVLGIVPGHGGHRHRQDLRQPVLDGGDDLEEMKSGLSSQKGITMLRILNDTTKKHRTKICLVLFGAPAGIRIPDTLIKSQVLYQLSYGHKYSIACYSLNIVTGMGEKVKLFAAFSARKSAAGQLVQEPEA